MEVVDEDETGYMDYEEFIDLFEKTDQDDIFADNATSKEAREQKEKDIEDFRHRKGMDNYGGEESAATPTGGDVDEKKDSTVEAKQEGENDETVELWKRRN